MTAVGEVQFQIALCVPDSCSQDDIVEFIKTFVAQTSLPVTVNIGYCINNDTVPYTAGDIVAVVVFSLFGIAMCLSVLYDVVNGPSRKHPLLTAFSVYTNGNRLLTIRPPGKAGDDISCVHGLRALSIMLVLLGHRFLKALMSPFINVLYMFTTWIKEYQNTYITAAVVSVESFLVLSGTLLTCSFLERMDKVRRFYPLSFYLHRFLHLTPALAAVVLLQATILNRIADGPIWNAIMSPEKLWCQKYWWSALLHIQNYYNPLKFCLGTTWYLSVDTQLFVLSPLILLPLWKWPKKTLGFITGLALVSVIVLIAISYAYEYPGVVFGINDPERTAHKNVYVPTHTRFGPWLIGVILGYFMHSTRGTRVKINKYFALGDMAECANSFYLVHAPRIRRC